MIVKKIKPLFSGILTTMDIYQDDDISNGIIQTSKSKGAIKEYQKVIEVGSMVRDIKVGDIVCINPTRFAVKKHQEGSLKDGVVTDNPIVSYRFPIEVINDIPYLLIEDRDIRYIVEEWEEDKPQVITKKKKLIQ